MSAPAKPGWKASDPEETAAACQRGAVAAFCAGTVVGIVAYHFLAVPAQADAPRTVSAVLMGVGQHLCKDWSGLRNIERVSLGAYTFTCEKYAVISNMEVR